MTNKLVACSIAVFFLCSPALAGPCEMSGTAVEAVTVHGNAVGKVATGETGFKVNNRELCFGGQSFSVREVRFKTSNTTVESRICRAQIADAKAYSGGSARGNGC